MTPHIGRGLRKGREGTGREGQGEGRANDFSAFRVRMFHKSVTVARAGDNESARCTREEEEDK